MRVKIIGAGSIGNHMAQASRRMGWDVAVVDRDSAALARMKTDIYPQRYGSWDPAIELLASDHEPKGGFDVIIIGTPPDSHMQLAIAALTEKPRLLHIEKPLCTPDLAGVAEFRAALGNSAGTIVTVGYDHGVAQSVEEVANLVASGVLGAIITIDVEFREHWRGIFAAHPWLAGPWETYLGYWQRGGGAGGEHSHALHLWLYFARALGWGSVRDVSVMFDMRNNNEERGAVYDRIASFSLKTERGNMGRVVQDVVTYPVKKWARLQGERGFAEWYCNGAPEGDLVRYQVEGGELIEKVFPKKRPDDFYRETLHYADLLSGKIKPEHSPLALERGVEVMEILQRAHRAP